MCIHFRTAGILAALLLVSAAVEAGPAGGLAPLNCMPASGLLYLGDRATPPTEFIDTNGEPAGINIDLLKGLERELGIPITIRLIDRVDATRAVSLGEAQITSLARMPSREAHFDFLAPTVRSRVSVIMRSSVHQHSSNSDLSGLRITASRGTYTFELLSQLPLDQRPTVVLVDSKEEAGELWKNHEVDGMAGSGSGLVWMARSLGERDFVEMPFETVPGYFATREGCGEQMASVTAAMQRLRDQGAVDIARERWFTPPESRLGYYLRIAGGVLVAILGAVLAWTWSLRRQVRERTAALEGSKAAAEAATRAKSEFLATMSHEIRTPLNAVIATASLLETTALDADQRELVTVVRQGGNTLLSVVSDVLDFSKIEAGRLELNRQPFDTWALFDEVMALVSRTASDKGLDLRLDLHGSVPQWLQGDAHRLRQVLLNLLTNAVKFTAHGRVELGASAGLPDPNGLVCLRVSVRDTGIGIPVDRLHRVFQPFTQADSSTTRRFGGTGLGLTISRSLIELMGGTIGVDSDPGRGSTFFLEVPLPAVTTPAALVRRQPPAHQRPLRVLMAEDNPVNRIVQRRMITHFGHTCDLVCDGQEAVDAAAQTSYDLIVLDLQMPVMGGLEAATQIRQQPNRPWLIVLTADVTADTRQDCADAGMDDFLTKPITLDALAEALAKVPIAAIAPGTQIADVA